MSGVDRLEAALRADGPRGEGPLLMCHAVCGYPDLATSRRILLAAAEAGAAILEAQIPFSEPSADGPRIVEANHEALRAARSGDGEPSAGPRAGLVAACLELLAGVRREARVPVLVMSYLNPIFAYGPARFVRDAEARGLDGLIVPDYPDDEPELGLAPLCAEAGLALVPLVAPTTSLERAASLAAASASPLVYAVLRLGVTGRRTELGGGARGRLLDLKKATGKRIAAGFGIGERSQIEALRGAADCAVVGSALLAAAKEARAAGKDPAAAVAALVRSLRGAPAAPEAAVSTWR